MADFKTHITVSTALGVGYGAVAFQHFGFPAPTCVLAGTLCSLSGMLPDLDSDSGVPLRESLSFASACVPMLLLDRFRQLGWTTETIVLVGAGIYIAVRFGIGALLKKYTVHRGMFHSIPAAVIAGEVAFLLCVSGDMTMRGFKAGAVVAGFLSHLILDEIWSVRVSGGRIGLKSSSGTAMKLFGGDMWANFSCYAKLIILGVVVFNDPAWTTLSPEGTELHTIASSIIKKFDAVEARLNLPSLPTALSSVPQSAAVPNQNPNVTPPVYVNGGQAVYVPPATPANIAPPMSVAPYYPVQTPNYVPPAVYNPPPQSYPGYGNTPYPVYVPPAPAGAMPIYNSGRY